MLDTSLPWSRQERARRLLQLALRYPDEDWLIVALARECGFSEQEARFRWNLYRHEHHADWPLR